MPLLHETVLQFGAGRFLRAFADLFIDQANREGQAVGRVVQVQSTGNDRAAALNRQNGLYHVLARGLENGREVDRVEVCQSVSRALAATSQWDEVLALARSPHLRVILSNTTEKGYDLDSTDAPADSPPRSFPAKLLAVLRERFMVGLAGVTIIPCELREGNADLLQKIVVDLARQWNYSPAFLRWASESCYWLNTLVDRIVTGPPRENPLLGQDALLTVCEPYALWAIQRKHGADQFLRHPNLIWTDNVHPYFLRKVRILNGGHTALLIKARPRGFQTVREAVLDPELGQWLERLLFEEVVPTLEGRVEKPAEFVREVLDRFRNPFLEHQLADIAIHHEAKVEVRLKPTAAEFQEKFGKVPPLLTGALNAAQPQ
jgi:tagaturonate reductase